MNISTLEAGLAPTDTNGLVPEAGMATSVAPVTSVPMRKVSGAGRARGAKKAFPKGAGKNHTVAAKVDSVLRSKLTVAGLRSGMSGSALMRVALEAYLDNLEQRSIAAEISRAAGVVAASTASMDQRIDVRMSAFEVKVQAQMDAAVKTLAGLVAEAFADIAGLLGEPVELTDAGDEGVAP
jgi:hypothetical protein